MAFRSVVTLSRRESEVAELVRDGLTNREIASRLFLSERTVEGHVSQICNKLGVRSRVQIATRLLDDEASGARVARAPARPFRVISRSVVPPMWLLAIMAVGAPLPVIAAVYPWLREPAAVPAIVLALAQTCLALLFLIVPGVALLGLWFGRLWASRVAVWGLIATGSLVLLVAGVSIGLAFRSREGFRPADGFEFAYAVAVAPLVLLHLAAAATLRRGGRFPKVLATAASAVWIVRYGYGLSLSSLVLWLLWVNQSDLDL